MFPIPFNFPFRKKDGSVITIEDAISAGGGGGYTLPTASASTKGGIKVGSGLEMSGEVLNNTNPTPYSLPIASADVLGGVKVGTGLAIADGVLSNSNPTPYNLPTAGADVLGGVKVGSGLSIDANGVLSASGGGFSPTSGQITVGSAMGTPTANQLYKFGNMVMINFIDFVDSNEVQNVTIGELPDGFQPSSARYIPCIVRSGMAKYYDAYISITTSGGVFKVVKCVLPSDLYDASTTFGTVNISGIFAL